jgi:hypothetical protein
MGYSGSVSGDEALDANHRGDGQHEADDDPQDGDGFFEVIAFSHRWLSGTIEYNRQVVINRNGRDGRKGRPRSVATFATVAVNSPLLAAFVVALDLLFAGGFAFSGASLFRTAAVGTVFGRIT